MDTAYYAESYTYQRGDLGTLQSDWIKQMAERARAAKQRIILLTHHNGIDIGDDGTQVSYQQPLWNQVKSALGGVPDYWYWGHVHAGIAFQPYSVNGRKVIARCVGHGGIPYAPFGPANGLGDSQIRVEWAEFATAGDPEEPRRALNGFVLLTLDDEKIGEQFLDEKGNPRFPPVGPE